VNTGTKLLWDSNYPNDYYKYTLTTQNKWIRVGFEDALVNGKGDNFVDVILVLGATFTTSNRSVYALYEDVRMVQSPGILNLLVLGCFAQ
jgi:hypothetical protein